MTPHQMRGVLERVEYRDWVFRLGYKGEAAFLQAMFWAEDPASGHRMPQFGRKWLLSEHMTPSELVRTAFKAVLTAEEHEARERFKYKGRPIFGPHLDVEALHEAAMRGEDRRADRRPEPGDVLAPDFERKLQTIWGPIPCDGGAELD